MPAETEEQYQARLAAWQARAEKDPFPGPTPRRGDQEPIGEGTQSPLLTETAPGARLDTQQPDADRARMAAYLQQLTSQATTGGGAWEQALAQSTDKTKATAQALGQGAGQDPMAAARGIGNAQMGAGQRAVGQGNLLRAQTQQQAQGQLADVLGGQGALDAQQAGQAQAAIAAQMQANELLKSNARKADTDLMSAGAQGVSTAAGLSNGGRVPGEAQVFGDDERNDTVKAKLSPGEIVIPRSITERPDAAQAAAAFVDAVKARGPQEGQQAFAPGGEVGDALAAGRAGMGSPVSTIKTLETKPIDVGQYEETRDASLANADRLMAGYRGKGPSVAPQAAQNATDSTIAEAMRAQAGSRRPLDVTAPAAEQAQDAAGNAAGMVAGETQRAGEAFAQATQRQRAQDLAMATAQQQAAWRNSMMNAGISLDQQAQLRNLLGSAGQAAAGVSGLFTRPIGGGGAKSYGYDPGTQRYDTTPAWEEPTASSPSEWENPYAEGGIVAHLSRKGTRRAGSRPESAEPSAAKRQSDTGKRLRDRITPWSEDAAKGKRPSGGDPRDFEDLEPEFANGGEIPDISQLPARKDASPGILSRFMDYMASPVQPPQLLDAPVGYVDPATDTPEMAAERARVRSPSGAPIPGVGGAEIVPFAPRGEPARERPFIADPKARPAPLPAAPMPAAAPVRPAAAVPAAAAPGVSPESLALKAGQEKAAVESGQAEEAAGALTALQQGLEQSAIQQKERQAQAAMSSQRMLAGIQQAREEMKAVDTEVDEGKWWGSRSVPGKIAAIIGLVLGAVGNDNGVNRAAMLISKQIDQSIDAQKASHELALRKGQAGIQSAENLYTLHRQMTQDDIAADSAARGTLLDLTKNKIDLAAAKAGSPMAKANLSALSARLAEEKQAKDIAAKNRAADMSLKWYAAKTDREAAGVRAAAGDKTQAALLDTVQTEETTIRQQGEKLKALIKKYGTSELQGPAEAEMRQAVDNMATAAAKMKDPASAARPSEVEMEAKNIFKPGFFQKADTALAQIDSYLSNAEQRKKAAYDARGVKPDDMGGDQNAAARAWLAANPNDPRAAAIRAKLGAR